MVCAVRLVLFDIFAGHLVVRHDVLLDGDSNVEELFPKFRKTKEKVTGSMDGDFTEADGYFVKNFTLAEVKTLRCIQRMPVTACLHQVLNCSSQ